MASHPRSRSCEVWRVVNTCWKLRCLHLCPPQQRLSHPTNHSLKDTNEQAQKELSVRSSHEPAHRCSRRLCGGRQLAIVSLTNDRSCTCGKESSVHPHSKRLSSRARVSDKLLEDSVACWIHDRMIAMFLPMQIIFRRSHH